MSRLVCFGLGYCARALARRLEGRGWSVAGTARTADGVAHLRAQGLKAMLFSGESHEPGVPFLLPGATHMLLSAPPDEGGDPLLRLYADELARAGSLAWIGYLSTVGVYGDHAGGWVGEETEACPTQPRTVARLEAERAWQDFGGKTGICVAVFRLAGIYGPGRNAIRNLLDGRARRIVKPDQVFNRAHVDDIAAVLEASMAAPNPGAIYNIADDEPAPPQDVVAHAAELLGMPPPPEEPFATADLSAMARSFYGESRRVANARIKSELGVALRFPTYREGLRALLPVETQQA